MVGVAVGDLRLYLPDGEGITVDLYATRAEDRPSDPDIHTPWSRLRTVDESGGVRSTGVIGDGRTKVHMHAIGGDIHVLRLPAPDESS